MFAVRITPVAAALVASLGTAATAASQEVTFAGYSNAMFGAAVAPSGGAFQTTSFQGLVYRNSTFDGTTAAGFRAWGGDPSASGINTNNFGSLQLGVPASGMQMYAGTPFNLLLTFDAPAGTSPSSAAWTAVLTGAVSSTGGGGITVDFDNTPLAFTFEGGSFLLTVNDLSVDPGQTAEITGFTQAQVAVVPEPATVVLLGSGILGLVGFGVVRRRRSA